MIALQTSLRRLRTSSSLYTMADMGSSITHRITTSCSYSTGFEAATSRLHNVLEEYRQEHYTQELPMRFKKEIVAASSQAAQKQEKQVYIEGLHQVLCNIGMRDRLSLHDLQIIFDKEGNESGAISMDRLYQII